MGLSAVAATAFLEACKPHNEKLAEDAGNNAASDLDAGRTPVEIARDKKLASEKFFDDHEMATIAVLCDIIIPKDDRSGSATDAKVPEFINFIANDMPDYQTQLRGGLRWMDVQSLNRYGKSFVDATHDQQIELVTEIAYPEKAKPEMQQGVSFFNTMRDLTATGFFTTKMGIDDLGYVGNSPNKWTGVPLDVLKQYGMEDMANIA